MVRYFDDAAPSGDVEIHGSLYSPAASGAIIQPMTLATTFRPWQPSSWPKVPSRVNQDFISKLRLIFQDSMLNEIENVIEDAKTANGDLQHRGHVVALALMCALDAVSRFGYRGKSVSKFVGRHFPAAYHPFAEDIYKLYRNSLVHSWNLFEATILPGTEVVGRGKRGTVAFGLLNFFEALKASVDSFLKQLETDPHVQANTLKRYSDLRNKAKS